MPNGVDPIRVMANTPVTSVGGSFTRDGLNAYQSLVDAITTLSGRMAGTYTVATLPAPGNGGSMVFVSDAAGGAVMAYDDGTTWRRVHDNSVVS